MDFDYEFYVVGDGPLRKELEELSEVLGVNAIFTGSVSKNKVAFYLSNSDLFILNSSYEGLPHIVLEAMHYGASVLASRVGGTPEIVLDENNGFLFEFDNIEELVNKIKFLKSNSSIREALVKSGKLTISELPDCKTMVDQYIETIENLLK